MVKILVVLILICSALSHQAAGTELLKVGIHSNNKTLEFVTSKGEPAGILVDLWREWARQSGIMMEFVAVDQANGTALLHEGKIDLLANAPPGEDFLYSPAYHTFDYSIFSLRNIRPQTPEDFPPRTGLHADDIPYIDPVKLNNLETRYYADHLELLNALENGDINYLLANTSQLILEINNTRLMKLNFPQKKFYEYPIRAALRHNKPQLLEKITTGFAAIDPDRRDNIFKKWMPSTVGYRIFWPFIGFAFFIMLSTILMTIVWAMNQRLKQQVWLATRELTDQANTDPLTRLINRRHFMNILSELLEQPRQNSRFGILLYLDLDNFKPVNDRLGHEAGDVVLQVIAGRLRNMLRGQDYVARLGGDEFALLLIDDSSEELDAETVARRVEEHVAAPIMVQNQRTQIRCSIGITKLKAGDQPQEVLNRADQAMYSVKLVRRRGLDPAHDVDQSESLQKTHKAVANP
jgi:diguanylate cyclase (GGDEF)-like protein